MPFAIDRQAVRFDMEQFDSLVDEEKHGWVCSELKKLRKTLAEPRAPGREVIKAIEAIPEARRKQYKRTIKYVIFSWPDILAEQVDPVLKDGRLPNAPNFHQMLEKQMLARMDPFSYTGFLGTDPRFCIDFMDLIYGTTTARNLTQYQHPPAGSARYVDEFNDASCIGQGDAFKCGWMTDKPLGSIGKKYVLDQFKKGMNNVEISHNTRMVYVYSLLNSRYSPTQVFNDSKSQLEKNKFLSPYWGKARFVQAVRRACKGGIAMVASHPRYIAAGAKVHFLLDGMGDLGHVARKDTAQVSTGNAIYGNSYAPITTSELLFCCRYWKDPDYPLKNVVLFYIKGEQVYAPWEADYRLEDYNHEEVYSNQEAFLRYRLALKVLGTHNKPFPRMDRDYDDQELWL